MQLSLSGIDVIVLAWGSSTWQALMHSSPAALQHLAHARLLVNKTAGRLLHQAASGELCATALCAAASAPPVAAAAQHSRAATSAACVQRRACRGKAAIAAVARSAGWLTLCSDSR